MLEKGVDREDEALRVLSLRALGNVALGAPKKVCRARCPREGLRGRCRCVPGNPARADGSRAPQVRQYRKLLLEKCLCSLRGPVSPSVTAEGLEALAKALAELREGDVGSDFRAISERCRAFFDHVSPHWSLAQPWPSWGPLRWLLSGQVATSNPLKKRRTLEQKGLQGLTCCCCFDWLIVASDKK